MLRARCTRDFAPENEMPSFFDNAIWRILSYSTRIKASRYGSGNSCIISRILVCSRSVIRGSSGVSSMSNDSSSTSVAVFVARNLKYPLLEFFFVAQCFHFVMNLQKHFVQNIFRIHCIMNFCEYQCSQPVAEVFIQ